MLLGDIVRKHEHRNPEKLALIDEKGRKNFREVNHRVNQIIHTLQDKGFEKGDRIAVLLYNCNEYAELFFALAKAGFVLVTINYRLLAGEFLYILKNAEPKAFIFAEDFLEAVASIRGEIQSVKAFIVVGSDVYSNNIDEFEVMIADYPTDEPYTEVSEDDLAIIMYTSGTTGVPKGAMITQKNIMAALFNQFSDVCPHPDDILFNLPPLYHMGAALTFLTYFYRGCTHVTIRQFDPLETLEWSQKERPTVTHLVPAMQNMIMNQPGVEEYDLSSIRVMIYGASAMMVSQLKQSMNLFQCKYFQFAGLTEVTGHLTTLMPEDHVMEGPLEKVKRLGSAGREVMGLEVKIVDENGQECAPGVPGEEIARGDAIMAGYWKMPDETKRTIKEGWLYTGDICTRDQGGYIYYVDRSKDMINRGGENVYPREVEEVIATHPGVFEVAVIGVPDDRLGEEIKAVIVPKSGYHIRGEDIIDLCKEHLAAYKKPRSIDFVDELPKNPTGKILKRVLRESYTLNP
jgi:acyl-CoA synthetase (AMP-forming)/AMP-acid ligase II